MAGNSRKGEVYMIRRTQSERLGQSTLQKIRSYPIVEYANIIGLSPKKVGQKYYTLKDFDSVRINTEWNCFIRNSNGTQGDIIQFSMEFRNIDREAAIRDILDIMGDDSYTSSYPITKPIKKEKENRPLELPPLDLTSRDKNVFAYLVKTRKIDKDIVSDFIKKNQLYQDIKRNCVFVSFDETGKADFACLRGTNPNKRFIADVAGCNYQNCFYINNHAATLIVTESVIDSMSVMSVMKNRGRNLYNYNYLALAGTQKYAAVKSRLERQPEINTLVLAVDNDQGGWNAIEDIKQDLDSMGWQGKKIEFLPPNKKDWNEELIYMSTAPEMESEIQGDKNSEVEL